MGLKPFSCIYCVCRAFIQYRLSILRLFFSLVDFLSWKDTRNEKKRREKTQNSYTRTKSIETKQMNWLMVRQFKLFEIINSKTKPSSEFEWRKQSSIQHLAHMYTVLIGRPESIPVAFWQGNKLWDSMPKQQVGSTTTQFYHSNRKMDIIHFPIT